MTHKGGNEESDEELDVFYRVLVGGALDPSTCPFRCQPEAYGAAMIHAAYTLYRWAIFVQTPELYRKESDKQPGYTALSQHVIQCPQVAQVSGCSEMNGL